MHETAFLQSKFYFMRLYPKRWADDTSGSKYCYDPVSNLQAVSSVYSTAFEFYKICKMLWDHQMIIKYKIGHLRWVEHPLKDDSSAENGDTCWLWLWRVFILISVIAMSIVYIYCWYTSQEKFCNFQIKFRKYNSSLKTSNTKLKQSALGLENQNFSSANSQHP